MSWLRRLVTILLKSALYGVFILVLITAVVVSILRWVPPPTSAFMIQWHYATQPYGRVDYRWVNREDISQHLPIAVVASEDQRFLLHNGFDVFAIRDAIQENRAGRPLRGASTISQQVAKNLFLWPGRSYLRKALEAYLTVFIEWLWPKRRILEVYVNIVGFGPGVFGAHAASVTYLGKSPKALTPEDAALLAAVLPFPNRYDITAPPPYLTDRAARIRAQMRRLAGSRYVRGL